MVAVVAVLVGGWHAELVACVVFFLPLCGVRVADLCFYVNEERTVFS